MDVLNLGTSKGNSKKTKTGQGFEPGSEGLTGSGSLRVGECEYKDKESDNLEVFEKINIYMCIYINKCKYIFKFLREIDTMCTNTLGPIKAGA